METANKVAEAQGAETKKTERTYSLTINQIAELGKNKAWMAAFRETAEAFPILTAKQVYSHTKPKE